MLTQENNIKFTKEMIGRDIQVTTKAGVELEGTIKELNSGTLVFINESNVLPEHNFDWLAIAPKIMGINDFACFVMEYGKDCDGTYTSGSITGFNCLDTANKYHKMMCEGSDGLSYTVGGRTAAVRYFQEFEMHYVSDGDDI